MEWHVHSRRLLNWIRSGPVQSISECRCYVVETDLTVNDSSCHVNNRLNTADLIFLYSREDAITVVDPTDDERVDEHLCRRCRQRAPDEMIRRKW